MYESLKKKFLHEIGQQEKKHAKAVNELPKLIKRVTCNMEEHCRPLYIDIMLRWLLFRASLVELEKDQKQIDWESADKIDGFPAEVFTVLRTDDFRLLDAEERIGNGETDNPLIADEVIVE